MISIFVPSARVTPLASIGMINNSQPFAPTVVKHTKEIKCQTQGWVHSFKHKLSPKSKLTENALSRLDTQRGFRDNTPVEAGGEFAYAGKLIKELCTSRSQHLNHRHGASIQTLDTIQLLCCLQLRRALLNTVVNTTLVLYHFKS
jgi:hypothetical protein